MNLLHQNLIKSSQDPKGMEELLIQAESVLKTWQPTWSPFISASLREEVLKLMAPIYDLNWHSDGGHAGAERQRVQFLRREHKESFSESAAPINGLRIEGNFLFDKATPLDIRKALEEIGAPSGGLGDIWIRGDRGAEALCTPETSLELDQKTGFIRQVNITCQALDKNELQLPSRLHSKRFTTVEASKRIDAITSAGFNLSRAKVTKEIRAGKLRLNWQEMNQPSRELTVGDKVQLEGKGTLQVLSLALTKRARWRVDLLRN